MLESGRKSGGWDDLERGLSAGQRAAKEAIRASGMHRGMVHIEPFRAPGQERSVKILGLGKPDQEPDGVPGREMTLNRVFAGLIRTGWSDLIFREGHRHCADRDPLIRVLREISGISAAIVHHPSDE